MVAPRELPDERVEEREAEHAREHQSVALQVGSVEVPGVVKIDGCHSHQAPAEPECSRANDALAEDRDCEESQRHCPQVVDERAVGRRRVLEPGVDEQETHHEPEHSHTGNSEQRPGGHVSVSSQPDGVDDEEED